ncbi:methylmalonic aciduria type A homolog, mitochondrial-like [Xenia sp. Carnegie-2017]|uniref:methylmalonic aciduria type A homolog, mitochondrial-like n=1 Tax=Xenia sp. Carnegie-2017 TaxID=2897299 RepID=UPI001F0481E0|nr:methylmalonic aciduria type A homolog, mitochondrial-like [Xenia sp. Carnegie-2017]
MYRLNRLFNYVISRKKSHHVEDIVDGIIHRDRGKLAEAITLVESSHPKKKILAQELLTKILNLSRKNENQLSYRIGISGAPGAGKSSFIEALGTMLTDERYRVAVLAVDPSSVNTGGSLLGDKTRMTELSRCANAYIRPSPSSGALGGVTRCTNDAIVLCESAGYDVIMVETVGVGQSELSVYEMVDIFVLLVSPLSGDELQGIKRGIMEVADLIIITKDDGDLKAVARKMKTEFISASKFLQSKRSSLWRPKIITASATKREGIVEAWKEIEEFFRVMIDSRELEMNRKDQRALWMWNYIKYEVLEMFKKHPSVIANVPAFEKRVKEGGITPGVAADQLLRLYSELK